MTRNRDALHRISEALVAVEEAILYSVLEKAPDERLVALREAHEKVQAAFNIIEAADKQLADTAAGP